MHLLRVVRRLADDAEAKAGEHNASLTADDSAALQTAMEELEEMRAARRRQEEMVAAIVQQRDMCGARARARARARAESRRLFDALSRCRDLTRLRALSRAL